MSKWSGRQKKNQQQVQDNISVLCEAYWSEYWQIVW